MAHLLIVDDDTKLRDLLKRYLRSNGYQVSAAQHAETAKHLLDGLEFDLIILDVMMPGEDGISFANKLTKTSNIPIIMLTARSELGARLESFEAGVDDFLAKPFEPKELLYRIDAILRRAHFSTQSDGFVLFGEYRFDYAERRLSRSDKRINLTRNEAELLDILVKHIGTAVNRETLGQALADQEANNPRAVDVQITRLRKKIEPEPKNPRYIKTIRGQGYQLINPTTS